MSLNSSDAKVIGGVVKKQLGPLVKGLKEIDTRVKAILSQLDDIEERVKDIKDQLDDIEEAVTEKASG